MAFKKRKAEFRISGRENHELEGKRAKQKKLRGI